MIRKFIRCMTAALCCLPAVSIAASDDPKELERVLAKIRNEPRSTKAFLASVISGIARRKAKAEAQARWRARLSAPTRRAAGNDPNYDSKVAITPRN